MEAPYHIYFFQINLRVSQWKALSVKVEQYLHLMNRTAFI